MDVLSPLLTVADLRKLGVTLHMNINDKREEIPDVPSIYFLLPTSENIKLIGSDLKGPLYREFYINFASMVSRSQLEELATLAVESNTTTMVKKVFDQYMDFVALEPKLFSLNIKQSFIQYNDPRKDEGSVMEYIDRVVEGLFAAVATAGVVPVIRAKVGTAAEMTATKLEKKIKDYIAAGSALFTDRAGSGGASFSRPVLLILDRETDYVTMLHHCITYQALAHDLLDIRNNCVNVTVKRGGSGIGGSNSNKRTYHLDSDADDFWCNFAGAAFPEAVQNNDKELKLVTEKEMAIRQTTSGEGEGKFDVAMGMRDLLHATDSLPLLLEKKKKLEMHTSILSATMEKIAQREIPTFYEMEDQMVMTGMVDRNQLELIVKDPTKGSLQDKLRLLSVALLSTDVDDFGSLEKLLITLSESASKEDLDAAQLSSLDWLKKHRAFSRPKKAPSAPIMLPENVPTSASNAFNMGLNLATGLLAKATAQVKTFLPGSKRLPATTTLGLFHFNNIVMM